MISPRITIRPFSEGDATVMLETKTTTTTKRSAPPPPPSDEEQPAAAAAVASAAGDRLTAEERDVVACEVGLEAGECAVNEVCAPPNNRSRDGRCSAVKSFWLLGKPHPSKFTSPHTLILIFHGRNVAIGIVSGVQSLQ